MWINPEENLGRENIPLLDALGGKIIVDYIGKSPMTAALERISKETE